LEIRGFCPEDGPACHELRRAAFLGAFASVLSQEAVQTGAGSYSIPEFTERIREMMTYVASTDSGIAGFCSIQQQSRTQAELVYLYVDEEHRGAGIGSALVRQAERSLSDLNPMLETLFLQTAVPKYNQAFWERMGYRFVEAGVCEYPTGRIPAVRLEKKMKGRAPSSSPLARS
jgi:ribosomal protein S18 acetylase RimI-like enzyme